MADPFRLEQMPHLDRTLRRKSAIGINQLRNAAAQSARNDRHNGFGPPRPFVDITATFRTHPPFEGVKALLVAQPHKPLRLVLGRNIPLHRRRIGPEFSGFSAEQFHNRLALAPAAQIP